MSDDVEFTLDEKAFRIAWEDAPDILNEEMNRELPRTGGEFARRFTKQRLGKGGIRIRRKGVVKKTPEGQPALPKKMRLAGFKGEIRGRGNLETKRVAIRTRSPVMHGHEFGATRTKAAPGFLFRFTNQRKGITKKQREQAFVLKKNGKLLLVVPKFTGKGKARRRELVAIAHFVQRVHNRARLGFRRTFRGFTSRAFERIAEGAGRALKRLTRRRA